MTKHIPNFLTLCNLACGCYGVTAVFEGDLQTGAIMIWAGAMFDFFDGFAARMLRKFSPIGKDLDSLADLITFCFLPSVIIYSEIMQNSQSGLLPYLAFLLALFGALRLAKFNNDTRQSESFHGLPVPASGIFVSALPFVSTEEFNGFFSHSLVLVSVTVLLSAMMVSDFRLMSLKFKDLSFKANGARYLLILISILLIAFFKIVALPLIILWYVVLSLAINIRK